jgi:putative DNA primase/helicase
VTIPDKEQQKTFALKIIKQELPGVFNWIINGLKRLLETEEFTESKIVNETIATYKRESDSVACFADEQPEIVGTSLKTTYAEYRSYCLDCGFKPLGRNNFAKRLQAHGFLLETMRDGVRITHKEGT